MPEYLSPGVYVEEVPARLKAIEGVSTSTVGFAGVAERGPVPGYPLPFDPESSPAGTTYTIPLPRDSAPRLVTSFGDLVRIFGDPLPMPDPDRNAYLARAVRAFFENGGKRCYVSRVVHWAGTAPTALRSETQLDQGSVLHLTRRVQASDTEIYVNSLRGVATGSGVLTFLKRSDGTDILGGAVDITGYDVVSGRIDINVPGGVTMQDLDPADTYIVTAGVTTGDGPVFHARTPGSWGDSLRIATRPADRGPVELAASASAAGSQVQVATSSGFYRGAIVEINDGANPLYREVTDKLPGNILQLDSPLGTAITVPGTPTPYVRVVEIDVVISDDSGSQPFNEVFRGLTWNPHPRPETRRRYYAAVINNRSRLVYVQPPGFDGHGGTVEDATLATQPTTGNGFETTAVTTSGVDDFSSIVAGDYVGSNTGPDTRTGIHALRNVDDISIIACPGRFDRVVQNALITQCENMRYRFAVLDADPADQTVTDVLSHRNHYDSSYAAYYYPWVEVVEYGQQLFLPSSGFVTGIYARSDIERGVHKAPANEVVRGITGLQSYITTGEQDILNPRGVNAIRQFEGRGIRVWGARTLSSDPEYRYVSTRRFLIFLEKSLERGTQWVVFEPNSPETWERVADSVSAFLHTQWRAGALLGRVPEQAFFVRCDETTMTADDIENGRLICNIGVAIVKPAEFVIFRIEQITAFAENT